MIDTAGNQKLYKLTSQGKYQLRIDLSDFDGNSAFAKYDEFSISDNKTKVKLTANGYYGTAGRDIENTLCKRETYKSLSTLCCITCRHIIMSHASFDETMTVDHKVNYVLFLGTLPLGWYILLFGLGVR